MRRRLATTILLTTTLLLLPVATNVATSVLPGFLLPYLWIAWPVAITLAGSTVAIEFMKEKGEDKTASMPGSRASEKGPAPDPEQALQVHARMLAVKSSGPTSVVTGIRFGVINDSDGSIFDVFSTVPGSGFELRVPSIGPGETRSSKMYEIDVIGNFQMFGNQRADDASVAISFVDRNGVRWKRWGYAPPTSIEKSVDVRDLFPGAAAAWGKLPKK